MTEVGRSRILVIKLSALGDFIQALGPMAAIRRHHGDAEITLLTTRPYVGLAAASGLVDRVVEDRRPRLRALRDLWRLRAWLRGQGFVRVYDLQTSDRSNLYFRLMGPGPRPEWSGIAKGCSHPHANPDRDAMHTVDRQAEQLRFAGIPEVPPPDLSWAETDVTRFDLRAPYVLLCPGGAAHRPAKRWPVERFGVLAKTLADQRLMPVLLGTAAERDVIERIRDMCPKAKSLMGRTDFIDIATLARGADFAVGNDTGPMHLIAAAGARAVVLFSRDSNPLLCAPRGPDPATVQVVQRGDLRQLGVGEVLAAAAPG